MAAMSNFANIVVGVLFVDCGMIYGVEQQGLVSRSPYVARRLCGLNSQFVKVKENFVARKRTSGVKKNDEVRT